MEVNDNSPQYYKSAYQHWDFAIKIPLGYLEGCTTKYVTRWRKKHGIKDLRKALHYLDKLIVTGNYEVRRNTLAIDAELDRYATANNLDPLESQYIFILCTYRNEKALKSARQILIRIMDQTKEITRPVEEYKPGTPEDGGHHSRAEE